MWPAGTSGFTEVEREWVQHRLFYPLFSMSRVVSSVMCPVLSDSGHPKHQRWKYTPDPHLECPQPQESLHIIQTYSYFPGEASGVGTHCLESKNLRTVTRVHESFPQDPFFSMKPLVLSLPLGGADFSVVEKLHWGSHREWPSSFAATSPPSAPAIALLWASASLASDYFNLVGLPAAGHLSPERTHSQPLPQQMAAPSRYAEAF